MTPEEIKVLIANIIGGIGLLVFCLSCLFKSKRKVLITQTVNNLGFSIASEIILKAYVGLVSDVIAGIRNLLVVFKKNSKIVNYVVIILGLVVSVIAYYLENDWSTFEYFMSHYQWVGILPIIANLQYSIVVMKDFKNPLVLRFSLIFSTSMWTVYCFIKQSYVGAVFNIVTAIINIVMVILILKNKNKVNEEIIA